MRLIPFHRGSTLIASIALVASAVQSLAQGEPPAVSGATAPAKASPVSPGKHRTSATSASNVSAGEQVTVQAQHLAGGLMTLQTAPKSVSTVAGAAIAKRSPLLSPSSIIASLPGVQGNTEGPLSTENETIHIRGLDQSQIGILYEGIPTSDPFVYFDYSNSAVDPENLASVKVTQGSSDITAPTYNADGAQISLNLRDPSDRPEAYAETTAGTHSTVKEFARIDTGEIGHSGVSLFVSGSYSGGDLWRGPGTLSRWHMDDALMKSWGPNSWSKLVFSFDQSVQNEWLYPTLSQFQKLGDGYNLNSTYAPGDTLYYKLNTKHLQEVISTIENHLDLGHGLSIDANPYVDNDYGDNIYGQVVPAENGYDGTRQYAVLDNYPARSGNVTVESVHPFVSTISGLNLVGAWVDGGNTLKAAYNYSYVYHTEMQNQYPVPSNGLYTRNDGYLTVFGGTTLTPYNVSGVQQENAMTIDDTLRLFGGRLVIDGGIRTLIINRAFTQDVPGADPYKSTKNVFQPDPQLLISYQINRHDQLYVNGTTGVRLPSAYQSQLPVYSFTTAVPSSLPLSNYQPEYMIGEEIGFRHYGWISATVAAFNYNLTNHQINGEGFMPGSTIPITESFDAGGESARGIQAEAATKPVHHVSLYASGQYMTTEIGNNVFFGGDYLPTKGKQEVAAPKFIGAIGLNYDDGVSFATFDFRYSGSEYSTLMNDQGIPAYFTADASLGRYLPTVGHVRPKLMLSLLNLGDIHYLSGVYAFTPTAAVSTRGIFGHTIAGTQPTYLVGTGFTALVTLAATFR